MSQTPWQERPDPQHRPSSARQTNVNPDRPAPAGHPHQEPSAEPSAGYGRPGGPRPAYGPPSGARPPKSHLAWAIVSIFLFWPLGIPAVVFAAQVNGRFAAGDVAGAEDSSSKARLFALIATIIAVIGLVLAVAGVVIAAIFGDWNG